MARRTKPSNGKADAKLPRARNKSPKDDGASVRDLTQRLTEALAQLQTSHRELAEAHEQQAAAAEILRVISGSPTDVQPVFEVVLASGVRLCRASFGGVFRFDGELIHLVTSHEWPPEQLEAIHRRFPMPPGDGSLAAKAIRDRHVVQTPDYVAESRAGVLPEWVPGGEQRPRSTIAIPMLREGSPLGAIVLARAEPGLFSDKHVALLQTFADQAVIAIENVRLFTETKEALDRQTATAEILRVIATSPTELQPVLDTIARDAALVCDAYDAVLFLREGDGVRAAAHYGPINITLQHTTLSRGSVTEAAILDRQPVHIHDVLATEPPAFPLTAKAAREGGFRTVLSVPLLRENEAIGALAIRRREVQPFSNAHIDLLRTFADQAVIAIENVRLFTELQEKNEALTQAHAEVVGALDRQTATSEVLRVISNSPTDIQPVFDAILQGAVTLSGAVLGAVYRREGDLVHLVGLHRQYPKADAVRAVYPAPVTSALMPCRAVHENAIIHLPDTEALDVLPPEGLRLARLSGFRSVVAVPMRRGRTSIGAILVGRPVVGPFPDEQVALLQTFADQAVIAIENVRLFKELEARNRDLTEALQQQTATAEILRVIAGSPTDIQPVLDAVAQNAARVCGADDALIYRVDGDVYQRVAHHGPIAETAAFERRLSRDSVSGRATVDRRTIHVPDIETAPGDELPETRRLARLVGARTHLAAPLIREGAAIGAILIRCLEVRPFAPKQISLLETFADQAVIAIENVRLFKELQQKNEALTKAHAQVSESLEQQTATSEILGVIGRSPTNVQPVFDAIVRTGARLCEADYGFLARYDGTSMAIVAHSGATDEEIEAVLCVYPMVPTPDSLGGRTILERAVIRIPDVRSDPTYGLRVIQDAGWRTGLGVPLLREGAAIGAVGMWRRDVRPFSDGQIELLKTFAHQAVIAIENVRLFNELQARTHELTRSVGELTALGEVSRALSSTLNLEAVLQTIVLRANELAGTAGCTIWEYDAGRTEFRLRASDYPDEADAALLQGVDRLTTIRQGVGATTQVMERRQPVQVADIVVEGADENPIRRRLIEAGHHALLAVPLISEDEVIGVLAVTRKAPGEFEPETVRLLTTFATQSALAIQNARLFLEIEDKSRQLEVASQHKSEFLANMSHELRTPMNAILGFSEVLAEGMFGEINDKQAEYLRDILESGRHLLSLINDILDLSKIEAGRMELEPTDFDLPGAIDNAFALVRERAGRRGIALVREIDPRVGMIRGDERKVKQVVLNLLSNAIKFTPEEGRIDVRAAVTNGSVEVSVADTGIGIAPEDQAVIFEEFRQVGTADKKVEGTGLGLALSRKFVELHGGRISVTSEPGRGSTFTFTLPARRGDKAVSPQ